MYFLKTVAGEGGHDAIRWHGCSHIACQGYRYVSFGRISIGKGSALFLDLDSERWSPVLSRLHHLILACKTIIIRDMNKIHE